MGFWGLRPFENDVAADFSYELESSTDWRVIEKVLHGAAHPDYLSEIDDDCLAYAAAEVVATAMGYPTQNDSWTEAARQFVARVPPPRHELISHAQTFVDLLSRENSSLSEEWHESDAPSWVQAISDLSYALQSARRASPDNPSGSREQN